MGKKYLGKQAILASTDRKFVDVEVPEWGGTVRVGEMTALERDRFELEQMENEKNGPAQRREHGFRAALVARCLVDDKGEPLLTPDDLEALNRKSSLAMTRVFREAMAINGMGRSEKEEEKAQKNSSGAQLVSLPSGSHGSSGATTSTGSSAS